MKKNKLAFGAIAVLCMALGLFWGLHRIGQEPPKTSAVDKLLSQSMTDTSGQLQHLAQWKQRALIVNFWATWCAPCVQEMPALSALQSEIAPDGIQIIGVGIDSAANIAQFAAKYQITYPLYTGGINATDLLREFGDKEGGLPFTVLIGHDGRVRKTYLGRLKMEALRRELAGL